MLIYIEEMKSKRLFR